MRSIAAAMGLAVAVALPATAETPRVALKGYDPVAYFTESKPVKGDARLPYDWDEARYHFSNAKHRDMFAADPERYAPRFSGNCTAAVAKGMKYEGDPQAWMIVGGKLYLFSSATAKKAFEANPSAIARAEEAWRASR